MPSYYIYEAKRDMVSNLIEEVHAYRVMHEANFDVTRPIIFSKRTLLAKMDHGFSFQTLYKQVGEWYVGHDVRKFNNRYVKIDDSHTKEDDLGGLPEY